MTEQELADQARENAARREAARKAHKHIPGFCREGSCPRS